MSFLGVSCTPRQSQCVECLRMFTKTHPAQLVCSDESRAKRAAKALAREAQRQKTKNPDG